MALLSAQDLETVRRQQVKNILQKQAAGKPLTAREQRIVEEAAAETPVASVGNFARTIDELATALGVSRKSVQNWQRRFPEDHPRPRADGRHDVAAWLRFMGENHLANSEPGGAEEDLPVTIADWKARELELKCEKLAIENAKVAAELVAAKDVEAGLSALLASARQALNNLPGRAAQKMLHLTDFHEAEELLQGEVDIVLRSLERCEFLDGLDLNQSVPVPVSPAVAVPADDVEVSSLPPKGKPRGKAKAILSPGPIKSTAPSGIVGKSKRGGVKTSKAAKSARVKRKGGKA